MIAEAVTGREVALERFPEQGLALHSGLFHSFRRRRGRVVRRTAGTVERGTARVQAVVAGHSGGENGDGGLGCRISRREEDVRHFRRHDFQ